VIGFIVYGRLTSTRLPEKALLAIDGTTLVAIMRDRVRLARSVKAVVFATSNEPGDDPLAALAHEEGLPVYRGHPDDVLRRLYEAATEHGLTTFLTASIDTPIQFGEVLDRTIDLMDRDGLDMASSYPSQPNGTDCYGLRTSAVNRVVRIKSETDTSAWGKYFTDTGLFRCGDVNLFEDAPHQKEFRLTIDYPEDLAFVSRLYRDLVARYGRAFELRHLKTLLDTPAYHAELPVMAALNRRWGAHFTRSESPVVADVERIRARLGPIAASGVTTR